MSRIDDLIRWEQFHAKKARKEAREAAEERRAQNETIVTLLRDTMMPLLTNVLGQYTGATRPTAFPCGAPNPVDDAAPIADSGVPCGPPCGPPCGLDPDAPIPFRSLAHVTTEVVDLGTVRIPASGSHEFHYTAEMVSKIVRLFVQTSNDANVLVNQIRLNGKALIGGDDPTSRDVPSILFAAMQPDPEITFDALLPGASIKVKITNPQVVPIDVKVYGTARIFNPS